MNCGTRASKHHRCCHLSSPVRQLKSVERGRRADATAGERTRCGRRTLLCPREVTGAGADPPLPQPPPARLSGTAAAGQHHPSLPPARSAGGPCPASGSASGAHPGSVLGASLMPLPALPAARPAGSSGRRAGRRRGAAELPSAPLQSPGPGEDRASRPAVPSAPGPAAAKGGPGAERSGAGGRRMAQAPGPRGEPAPG